METNVSQGFTEYNRPLNRAYPNPIEIPTPRESTTTIGATNSLQDAESWPQLGPAAYHGLAGEFVQTVEPFSEADPVAILLQLLTGAGSLIGSQPHALVEETRHEPRLNLLLVGQTAQGRKGTALNIVRMLLASVDDRWECDRVKSGMSSGEGLIALVRDARVELQPIRQGGRRTGNIIGYEHVQIDSGEEDKRLLVVESEFASALKVMDRAGNTLSPVIRDAWDKGNLSVLTKNHPLRATGAHISLIGHITQNELLRNLTATERANGFANRFLFALVKRSKYLPNGKGTPRERLTPYFTRFSRTIEQAKARREITRDEETEEYWSTVYPTLEVEIPGLTGAILARGAPQVLRLSLLYALLDETEIAQERLTIRIHHLKAALAVWEFCKASVFHIFGDAVGDSVADRILQAIKYAPQSDTDLYNVLGKHDGGKKEAALNFLLRLKRIHWTMTPTQGRPMRKWHLGHQEHCVLCV